MSPCECGEPLNESARLLLFEKDRFDPLDLKENRKLRGLSVYVGVIILSLALAESVSRNGFSCD